MNTIKNTKISTEDFKQEIKGIPLSKGVSIGNVLFAKDTHSTSDFKDKIAVVHTLRVDQINSLAFCKGVITETGGMLSHTAIVAREFGIPCVGGIVNSKEMFVDGDVVSLDGTLGVVKTKGISKESTTNTANYELSHYNPKYIKKIKIGRNEILYSTNKNVTILYLSKIGSSQENLELKSKFSEELKIHPDSIMFSTIGVWEGSNAPSIVYMQHKDLQRIEADNQLNKLLKVGIDLINSLQINNLESHLKNINKEAHKCFIEGYKLWEEYKKSNKMEHADRAAKFFEEARVLSGVLIGNVLIEIYGISYIENEVLKLNTVSVEEIFNKAASTKDPKVAKLIQLASLLEKERNMEAQVLSANNTSFYDILNDFYKHNRSDLVEKYNW